MTKRIGRPQGIKRVVGKFLRISEREQLDLRKLTSATGLNEADFMRCRLFGYSFESMGGHAPTSKLPPSPSLDEIPQIPQ